MLNLLLCIKPLTAPLANSFGRGYLCRIGGIHQSHAIRGANSSAMVVMFVECCVRGGRYFLYYSYCRNPMGQAFFVSARTL